MMNDNKKNKNNNRARLFLYRVEVQNEEGIKKRHLAEVISLLDESARREIVHVNMKEKSRVLSIISTEDNSIYDGEDKKRKYHG